MTDDEVCRRRLAGQFLARRGPRTAPEVVGALGAIQAQEYLVSKWGVAQRGGSITDAEIEQDVAQGRILRTHVLRPTWHFVAPGDIRWMLALTGPRVAAAMASYNRKLELDANVFRRSHAAIEKALAGGNHLTRRELAQVLGRARVGALGTQRLAHLMMQAELDAVVTSGARRGKQSTYALMDERVPASPPRDRDDALGELARRYFATRSPATAHDFAWWSGLTVSDARRAIAIAGTALRETKIGDRPHWIAAVAPRPASSPMSAHLLPAYDEYFIGYKDRRAIGRRVGNIESVTGGDAFIGNVIVVGGQLVGGWKLSEALGTAVVQLAIVAKLRPAERKRVVAAAEGMATFLGRPVTVLGAAAPRR